MNRARLCEIMSAEAGISKTAAERALNAALHAMCTELLSGGRITLAGFGSFRVTHRQGRTGRNPLTGSAIPIAPCSTVKFLVSEELKADLNQNTAVSAAASGAGANSHSAEL